MASTMGAMLFSGPCNTDHGASFIEQTVTKPYYMTNATLGKKARRTRKAMSFDLQPGPRSSTIQFILGYSRALKVVDAPPVGQIDIVLN